MKYKFGTGVVGRGITINSANEHRPVKVSTINENQKDNFAIIRGMHMKAKDSVDFNKKVNCFRVMLLFLVLLLAGCQYCGIWGCP